MLHESVTLDLFSQSGPIRRFLGWEAPAMPAAAAMLAEHYARADELRLDACTVVVPGGRAGRRLKELLVEEAERRRCRLVPPRVVAVGGLPELLYEPPRPLAEPLLARRVWSHVLRELPATLRDRLFPASRQGDDLLGWTVLARVVQRLHTDVGSAGLRFRDVAARCRDGLLFADDERWQALDTAQADYEQRLATLGFADRDLARIDALEAANLSLRGDLWLVGVAEMPAITSRMLAALRPDHGALYALVHAPDTESAAFDALGCVHTDAWIRRPIPLDDQALVVCGRPPDQAAAAVAALHALGARYAADEIVVAVPDPELEPFLEQRLAAAGVPVRSAEGTPLERTAPFRLLGGLATYLEGRRVEAAAALVRHPDVLAWLDREPPGGPRGEPPAQSRPQEWLEALDAYRAEHLPSRVDRLAPAASGRAVDTVRRFGERVDGLLAARGPARLAEWAPRITAALAELYGGRPLDRSRPADRRLLEALEPLARAAAGLRDLPASVDAACDASVAIRILLDEAAEGAIAADPDAAAVELLGWLELHLDDAPVAVVTGFNEGVLPQSVSADPFLPDSLRSRLGLVDNDRRYARDAYLLTALLQSRQRVRVIAGRRAATGDPLRPSRLMLAVEGTPLAQRIRRFYGDGAAPALGAAAGPAPAGAQPASLEGRPPAVSGFRLPPEPVVMLDAVPARIAVTAFKQLLEDPYGYALKQRIGGDAVDDSARELDGAGFGSLAHLVLERFGLSPAATATEAAAIRAALDDLLDTVAGRRFGAAPLPAVRVQVEQLRARLHAFADWQAGWATDGWRIAAVECRTPESGVAFDVDGEPIALTGRIDRIDYHAGRATWAVLDYKTGDHAATPQQSHLKGRGEARRWVDLQLPLYRHLLPHVEDSRGDRPFAGGSTDTVEYGYILLPKALEKAGAALADWPDDLLASADDAARDAVRRLRANRWIWEGRAGAWPTPQLAAVLGIGTLRHADEEEAEP